MTGTVLQIFKTFGLQRTCTNIVEELILDNFHSVHYDQLTSAPDCKHAYIRKAGEDSSIFIIICTKNLHAWLVSCYKYFQGEPRRGNRQGCPHFRNGWTLAQFIRNPHYVFKTPIDRYMQMTDRYLDWANAHKGRSLVIRAEDLYGAAAQLVQLERLQDLGFVAKRQTLRPVVERIEPNRRRTGRDMDYAYYEQRVYEKVFSISDLNFIEEQQASLTRAAEVLLDVPR
jgi:hypothetical protein